MIREITPKLPLDTWHPWFAWRPVTATNIATGKKYRVWLESIERIVRHDSDAGGPYKQVDYRITFDILKRIEERQRLVRPYPCL